MNLLTNPILVRMALLLMATGAAFWFGVVMVRRMRKSLTTEGEFEASPSTMQGLQLDTFHSVIQQLKQQKHELQSEQQVERRRAKTSESISAAVLANLPMGVLFITPDGLVRQANAAAKRTLGFASPVGVKLAQIFRDAKVISPAEDTNLAEAIERGMRSKTQFQKLEADYRTPNGEERALELSLATVAAAGGEMLGVTCALNDQSELAQLRRQREWLEEVSGEMALDLHNSLNTISGYAQQMAGGNDSAKRLAADIAVEAAHLDHTLGGFLAGAKPAGSSNIKVAQPLDFRASAGKMN